MLFLASTQSLKLVLTFLLLSRTAISQGITAQGTCATQCNDYNLILENCEVDDDNNADYNFCVCNDSNFKSTNAACVACLGTGSAPYKFQQACKSVPPDCTVACSAFNLVIQGCTGSDPTSCVCGGAYDIQYSTTFNQAFTDCVACENGGGIAASWELTCCAKRYGCNGLTASTSAGASPLPTTQPAVVQSISSTTTHAASSSTPVNPGPTNSAPSLGGGLHIGSSIFIVMVICYLQTWTG